MKITLWKDKENGIIDYMAFSTVAEEFSKLIKKDHDTETNEKNKNIYPNKPSQIRKFYDEIVNLNSKAKMVTCENNWQSILPLIHMVVAKAAYARGRNLISDNFRVFIKEKIDEIQTRQDLEIFTNFFEAFYGFYKLHGPKN